MAARTSQRLLDPHFVSKLARLDLRARLVVDGFLTGLHKSPYHGFSVEFAEHRQYMPGDDLRHLDTQMRASKRRLEIAVQASGTTVTEIFGAEGSFDSAVGGRKHGVLASIRVEITANEFEPSPEHVNRPRPSGIHSVAVRVGHRWTLF